MSLVPPSFNPVDQTAVQFNNPVSEASLEGLAAPINGLLNILLPVGSIVHSMLTEEQFQGELPNADPVTWILADGRNVEGSEYNLITGNTTVPDLRGIFLRGKNNGRSDGNQNPDGDLTLGALQTNQFGSHNHGFLDNGHQHNMTPDFGSAGSVYSSGSDRSALNQSPFGSGAKTTVATSNINFSANGGNETRPTAVTVNIFIRIN